MYVYIYLYNTWLAEVEEEVLHGLFILFLFSNDRLCLTRILFNNLRHTQGPINLPKSE